MADRTIKSIGYDQHVIIRDILELHNGGNPIDCDITYSVGNFYGKFKETVEEKQKDGCVISHEEEYEIAQPTYKFDVDPQVEGVERIDAWGALPLEDNSIDCCMFDPPFVIGPRDSLSMVEPKEGSNIIGRRFSSYYPRWEMFESYEHWIREAYRVLRQGGVLIFKTQPVISGGLSLMTHMYACKLAEELGFYIKDEFVLLAKQRLISGKVKNQMHSRKYHSFFYVLVKDDPKRDKIGYFRRDWRELPRRSNNNNKTE